MKRGDLRIEPIIAVSQLASHEPVSQSVSQSVSLSVSQSVSQSVGDEKMNDR